MASNRPIGQYEPELAELRDWIRSVRRVAGMSQSQLAKNLGVAQVTVALWEQGRRTPRYESVCSIARLEAAVKDGKVAGSSGVHRHRKLGYKGKHGHD